MDKPKGKQAVEAAIRLIEEQLQAIPVAVATILHAPALDKQQLDAIAGSMQLLRKPRAGSTASVGNIIIADADSDVKLDFETSYRALQDDLAAKDKYLRIVIGNALLAVGAFFREFGMADMRTPEVQFLDRIHDAVLNGNRFALDADRPAVASFAGLNIEQSQDGMPLFGADGQAGFMEFGDAVALLQWLAHYLRGGENFVTAGDAG